MKTSALPASRSDRMMPKNSTTSCGVSTAVGSSKMMALAERNRTLMISTRCWRPTGISSMIASGSTSSPCSVEMARTCSRAVLMSSRSSAFTGSTPSTTFSATVKTGTSMKCWWTMPMPARIASPAPRNWTGLPSIRISPSSGR